MQDFKRVGAIVNLAANFQNPSKLIVSFIKEWENGSKVALGIKTNITNENKFFLIVRNIYCF